MAMKDKRETMEGRKERNKTIEIGYKEDKVGRNLRHACFGRTE